MNDYDTHRDRSRSPYAHERRHHRRRSPEEVGRRRRHERRPIQPLPFDQRDLTKYDLQAYRAMFALYLDIQKRIDIDELTEDEVKGRWKSFVKKWNRGELAEGWYDPQTVTKANKTLQAPSSRKADSEQRQSEDEDDLSDFGPVAPAGSAPTSERLATGLLHAGPTVPSLQDIHSREEDDRYAAEEARERRIADFKVERKLDRRTQKERLEDIAPRAEAGTRERQLEKKKEIAAANRAYAASKDAVGDVEVQESDLMGEDTLSELKRLKKEQNRRKTEREVKREEILRARAAEREERSRKMREKEAKTVEMLKELAQARFGDGNEKQATLGEDR